MRRMPSRVAIVGAGPIGCAAAAFLVQDGMAPAMWSPTGSRVQRQADRARFRDHPVDGGCSHPCSSIGRVWPL